MASSALIWFNNNIDNGNLNNIISYINVEDIKVWTEKELDTNNDWEVTLIEAVTKMVDTYSAPLEWWTF